MSRRLLFVLAGLGAAAGAFAWWRRAGRIPEWPEPAGRGGGPREQPRPAPDRASPPRAGSAQARVRSQPAPEPAAAPAERRCAAITQGGSRCTREAEAGSEYCWQHSPT